MKAVILAGGLGTRLSEQTVDRPKPLVEIGGRPILWHIMKMYSAHNVNDFIICCGYKGYLIKDYFSNYALHMSDVTIEMKSGRMSVHHQRAEPWTVTLVDTGEATMTGGRLKRVQKFLENEENFCMTYGDGVGDINISDLIEFHEAHGRLATLTATYPSGRFGALELDGCEVQRFKEKPRGDGAMINGGFFVLSRKIFDYLGGDETIWEEGPLKRLAEERELMAFHHEGFWQPMDTMFDRNKLEKQWSTGAAPWMIWK